MTRDSCRIIFCKHNALPIIEDTSDQKVRNQGEKPALISRSTYHDIRQSYLCPVQGGLFCCARHSPQSNLVRMLTVNVPVSLRFVKRRHTLITEQGRELPRNVDPSTFIECRASKLADPIWWPEVSSQEVLESHWVSRYHLSIFPGSSDGEYAKDQGTSVCQRHLVMLGGRTVSHLSRELCILEIFAKMER